jgi:hypothetical protein
MAEVELSRGERGKEEERRDEKRTTGIEPATLSLGS